MSWNSIWLGIGNFFEWIFDNVMKPAGSKPNIFLWILIVGLLGYQVVRMVKQNKEAERNGTLK